MKYLKQNRIVRLYFRLLRKYGNPEIFWPQWCAKRKNKKLREIIAIGAILVQKTSWINAELALRNLKKENLLSLRKIANLKNLDKLTNLLKPAGFYNTKPKRLYTLASFITKEYRDVEKLLNEDINILREKLLGLYGIGQETTDTLLLYALDKPSFIIDEYTKRFVKKYKLTKYKTYNELKRFFEKSLPRKVAIYQNFHILIIIDQKGKEKSYMKEL